MFMLLLIHYGVKGNYVLIICIFYLFFALVINALISFHCLVKPAEGAVDQLQPMLFVILSILCSFCFFFIYLFYVYVSDVYINFIYMPFFAHNLYLSIMCC